MGPDFYSAVLQRCQENYDSHGGSDCGPLPLDDKEDGKIDDNGESEKQYALDEKRSQKCKMADSTILAQRLHDTTQTMTDAKEKAFKAQEKLMEAAATETDNENKLVQQLTSIQPKVTNDLQNLRDQLSAKQIEARRTINSALAEINSADKDIDAIERQGAALREKFLKDLANLKLACEQGTMDNTPKGGYPMMSVNQLANAQSVGGLRVYKCMRDIKNRRGPEANLEFEYQSKMNELIRKEDEARTKIASLNNSIHIDDGALTDLQRSTLNRIDQETQAAATQTQALNTQLRQMQANSQKSMASLQSSYAADQKLFDDASSDYEFSRNGYQQLASKGILGETPNNDSSKDGSAPPMGVVINQGFEGASLMKKDPYEGCSGIASAGTSNSKSVAVTVGRQPAANTGSASASSSNSNPPSSTTGACADGTSNCTPQNATH